MRDITKKLVCIVDPTPVPPTPVATATPVPIVPTATPVPIVSTPTPKPNATPQFTATPQATATPVPVVPTPTPPVGISKTLSLKGGAGGNCTLIISHGIVIGGTC